jgi:hypothetical protein
MRQQADYIELYDADCDVITTEKHNRAKERQAGQPPLHRLPITDKSSLLIADAIEAEILPDGTLSIWLRRIGEPVQDITYRGTFIVYWHTPTNEDPQHLVVVARSPSMEDTP